MDRTLVIIGAGASYDGWDGLIEAERKLSGYQPPLANQLFDGRPQFREVARNYPGVMHLASTIQARVQDSAFNLETLLREFSTHEDERVRTAFKDIPLYIREIICKCSSNYVDHPGSLAQLVQALLPRDNRVIFLTTNYDTLIEQALTTFDSFLRFDEIDDYVERGVPLVKLHGSLDWTTPMGLSTNSTTVEWQRHVEANDVTALTGREIRVEPKMRNPGFADWKWFAQPRGDELTAMYPALTAPLAGKSPSDVIAPKKHVQILRRLAPDVTNVVIAGNSGLDDDLLTILDESLKTVQRVHICAESLTSAQTASARFSGAIRAIGEANITLFTGGFAKYVQSADIEMMRPSP